MLLHSAIRTGDHVAWDAPQFEGGSWFRGRPTGKRRFTGTKRFAGKVVRHSYGSERGQHTFTVLLSEPEESAGKKTLVKGRNLYPNLVAHRPDPESPDRRAF